MAATARGRQCCEPGGLRRPLFRAHLTFFTDAGFGLHLLGHWVRERGAMSLAEAVRRLTTDALGVHGVGVNGAQVADGSGLLADAPLSARLAIFG